MLTRWFSVAVLVGLTAQSAWGAAVPQPARIVSVRVYPTTIEIRHHRHPHSLQVLAVTEDGYSVDLRAKAKITSANPKVATLDERGWVRPVASGETSVTVEVGKEKFTVPVKVTLPATELPSSFRHEVMPILTRAGCNAGACHGYSLGKNGFKLSLRGQGPEEDYLAITQEFASRRVDRLTPAASLLLRKPVGDAPHEGGIRFGRSSLSYQILHEWIRQGTPSDLKDTARVTGVRVIPDKLTLRPGQTHQLQLIADYDDGTQRDVTRLAVFAANNDQFATMIGEGHLTAGNPGETAVVGRFERKFAAAGVTVLRPNHAFTPTPVPTGNLVDRHVIEKLNRLKITPSGLASDEEFLRRVYIDLIGVQPEPKEVRAFLADKDPKKREKVVDALFERPEFIDQWSLKWGDLLQNSRNTTSTKSVYLFREFIRSAVASNMPLDRFARKILTARGTVVDDPASVYFTISKDTNDTIERVTQVFCGVRMLCARCHAHPMENWTQADYYGLASFFTQVSLRADNRFRNSPNTRLVRLNLTAGDATNPRTRKTQAPKFLGGETPRLVPGKDRREVYAAWLTSPKNPFFARGLVNRIWSYFFHRGIIEPVDDVRSTNPPINPALLDALTQDFIESKFDVRHLMKRIVTSATYQRSCVPNASNRHDELNFSRAIPRRIPAEALLDSLVQATGVPENFGGAPGGFRAAQLPDGNVDNQFLKLFGKPERMDACECERDNSSNLLQALHFINGKSILGRVQNPNARPALLLREKFTDEQLITELYLWSLARNPSAKEQKASLAHLKSYGAQRAEAVQDLMWALLNSKDFLLLH
jgi:hypothetical protein